MADLFLVQQDIGDFVHLFNGQIADIAKALAALRLDRQCSLDHAQNRVGYRGNPPLPALVQHPAPAFGLVRGQCGADTGGIGKTVDAMQQGQH